MRDDKLFAIRATVREWEDIYLALSMYRNKVQTFSDTEERIGTTVSHLISSLCRANPDFTYSHRKFDEELRKEYLVREYMMKMNNNGTATFFTIEDSTNNGIEEEPEFNFRNDSRTSS